MVAHVEQEVLCLYAHCRQLLYQPADVIHNRSSCKRNGGNDHPLSIYKDAGRGMLVGAVRAFTVTCTVQACGGVIAVVHLVMGINCHSTGFDKAPTDRILSTNPLLAERSLEGPRFFSLFLLVCPHCFSADAVPST